MLATWIPKFPSLLFLRSQLLAVKRFSWCQFAFTRSVLVGTGWSWWGPEGFVQNVLSLLRSPVFSAVGMPSVSRNTPVWKTLLWWLGVNGDERQLRTVTVLWHDQGHVTMTLIPISGWPSWQSCLWTYWFWKTLVSVTTGVQLSWATPVSWDSLSSIPSCCLSYFPYRYENVTGERPDWWVYKTAL